ncbi:MAG: hypothetical protein IKG18_14220 [Atopobiaceae bacterium]|nr:hypothetical protein [Atopobiaceae bacterium]
MIIDENLDSIPYIGCEMASIQPRSKDEFTGTLVVDGDSYDVSITRDMRFGEEDRVCARVSLVDEANRRAIDRYALWVAQKATEDATWCNVKVDLRDGETAYMRTWTHDFPDDGGMDKFLESAAAFIHSNIFDLRAAAESSTCGEQIVFDDEFDLSLL